MDKQVQISEEIQRQENKRKARRARKVSGRREGYDIEARRQGREKKKKRNGR